MESKQIHIDFSDENQLKEIMDEYGDFRSLQVGTNPDTGEKQHISISHESIVLETFQNNGWIRRNTYYYDGDVYETFDGRWK